MINSFNYKTYYLGTPKEIEESSKLVLLNSRSFGEITLESLEDISEELDKKKDQIKEAYKDKDGFFVVELGGTIFDFDTILYYNPGSGYTGFTVFSSLQHCYSSSGSPFNRLKISLVFDRIEGEGNGFFIEIKNFLDPNVENTKILNSTEKWGYQKSESIFSESVRENYLGFTNRIPDYLEDKDSCIITETGIITNSQGISGLNILSGVEVDQDSFSFMKPVVYKGDIAILKFSFQTGEYCVSSLSTVNAFKRPYDYLSGTIKFDFEGFIGYNGQVLLFSDGNDYVIYPIESPPKSKSDLEKYPKKNGYVILDPLDFSGKVRYISDKDLKREIMTTCLVPSDFKYNSYVYKSKNGCWWEFEIESPNQTYLYTSVYGYIMSNSRVDINFLNSRIGIYIRDNRYHFIPIDYGHYYEVRKDGRVLDKVSKSYCDIVINPSDSLSSLTPENRCFLDGLRRKPIRTSRCLPEEKIIGMGLGMMFYLSSDNLLYCY